MDRPLLHPAGSSAGRADVRAAREAWSEGQPDLDPERLVFIAETGASTKIARLRGRARKGERRAPAVRMSAPEPFCVEENGRSRTSRD